MDQQTITMSYRTLVIVVIIIGVGCFTIGLVHGIKLTQTMEPEERYKERKNPITSSSSSLALNHPSNSKMIDQNSIQGDISLQRLCEALLNAFPTRKDLEIMVSYGLHENLSAITGEGNLQHVVFELVQWSKARGRLEELATKAIECNSSNPQLKSAAKWLIDHQPAPFS